MKSENQVVTRENVRYGITKCPKCGNHNTSFLCEGNYLDSDSYTENCGKCQEQYEVLISIPVIELDIKR